MHKHHVHSLNSEQAPLRWSLMGSYSAAELFTVRLCVGLSFSSRQQWTTVALALLHNDSLCCSTDLLCCSSAELKLKLRSMKEMIKEAQTAMFPCKSVS